MLRLISLVLLLAYGLSAQTGIISGVVRNAWSKIPLRRAVVTLSTTTSPPLDAVVYTDSNGSFAFTGIAPGEYYLCSEFRAYQKECVGSDDPGQPAQVIAIATGERKDFVIGMRPLGSISGTVTDLDGEPVQGAEVAMLEPRYERMHPAWRIVFTTNTDHRGEYHIPFVRPGKYRFMATHRYQPVVRVQPDVTNGQKPVEEMYATCFYPGSEQISGAATLALNAGNDLKGIDFTLVPKAQAVVAGKVIPPAGANENVNLWMSPVLEGFNALQLGTVGSNAAPPEYEFRFQNTSPGTYRLVASLDTPGHVARGTQLIQAGSDTDHLSIELVEGTPLEGRVDFEGKGWNAGGPYKVHLSPGDFLWRNGQFPEAEVKADGTYKFDQVVPGIWDIGVEPRPPGSYTKSMRLGKQDVLTEEMKLETGARPPLNIVVDSEGAIVKGRVFETAVTPADPKAKSAAPKPAGRSRMLLAPADKFQDVLSFYQETTSEPDGQFEFKSVTPGRYKLFAFDHMMDYEYGNPDFLKPYLDSAVAFDATPGSRLNRDVILIVRGPEGAN